MCGGQPPCADAHDKHVELLLQHCELRSQLQLPTHWISLRARSMRLLVYMAATFISCDPGLRSKQYRIGSFFGSRLAWRCPSACLPYVPRVLRCAGVPASPPRVLGSLAVNGVPSGGKMKPCGPSTQSQHLSRKKWWIDTTSCAGAIGWPHRCSALESYRSDGKKFVRIFFWLR
jgi:hypothetical protein